MSDPIWIHVQRLMNVLKYLERAKHSADELTKLSELNPVVSTASFTRNRISMTISELRTLVNVVERVHPDVAFALPQNAHGNVIASPSEWRINNLK